MPAAAAAAATAIEAASDAPPLPQRNGEGQGESTVPTGGQQPSSSNGKLPMQPPPAAASAAGAVASMPAPVPSGKAAVARAPSVTASVPAGAAGPSSALAANGVRGALVRHARGGAPPSVVRNGGAAPNVRKQPLERRPGLTQRAHRPALPAGRGGGGGVSHGGAPPLHSFVANRGGTRGFRAPEVLLRKHEQGPPIDVWAAGVVALCIASKRYPLFEADSDKDALGEIIALLDLLREEVPDMRRGRGAAAELGKLGSAAVERAGRLVLGTWPESTSGRGPTIGQGVEAWAAALGGVAARDGARASKAAKVVDARAQTDPAGGASAVKERETDGARSQCDKGEASAAPVESKQEASPSSTSDSGMLWELLNSCLRFDESERRTARQMLEMPLLQCEADEI